MKTILSYILAIALVLVALAGIAYFIFSKYNFLPWNQKLDQSFLSEPLVLEQPDSQYSDFERSDLSATEVARPYEENKPQIAVVEEKPKEIIIATYYSELSKPRMMALSPFGDLIVSDVSSGGVYALIDSDKDYKADKRVTIIDGLNNPHGLAFNANDLYIAETNKIRVLRGLNDQYKYIRNDVLVNNLSDSSGHFTRSLLIRENKIYVSIGSSCNACVESDSNRASVLRFNLDGSGKEIFSNGIRNAVGLATSPDNKIFITENGRDWLGDDLPPDEINLLELGGDFGWPYCYGNQSRDLSVEGQFDCATTIPPYLTLPAHSAPLGLKFYTGQMFPEFSNNLFVALHGSWNSKEPVGYKVVRYDYNNNQIGSENSFLDIFLKNKEVKGRPVDIAFGPQGEIFISDDFGGKIFIVYKR